MKPGLPTSIPERFFKPVVVVLLAIMAAIQVTTAAKECQTWDEHIHLSAGYAYWKAGAYPFNMEHPALVKLIAAAPLLLLNPTLPTDSPAWKEHRDREFGVEFLYHNRVSPERLLWAGRLPIMGLAILFGLAIAWWLRRRFGAAVALTALALYCLDPNIIAHSRYVTTDLPLAGIYFLASVAAVEYLETSRVRDLLVACLLFGVAMVTKYSAVVLLPAFALLYLVRWWQRPSEFPIRRLMLAMVTLIGVTLTVIAVVYWPDTLRCLRGGAESFAEWGDERTLVGRTLQWMGKWLHLPTHTYPFGLQMVADHNRVGHGAYLMGKYSRLGWWYYFPVAFLVKSTVASLLAALGVLAAGVWWLLVRSAGSLLTRLREAPFIWYGLVLPPAIFFTVSMTSTINIGLRHILPIYPFLYVSAAVALVRVRFRFSRVLLASVLTLQALECASIYPHYLAFFNAFSGGPANGPKYLVDSNIDWGQDLKKLARWLDAHGTRRVYLRYFGGDQIVHEGLESLDVPGTADLAGRAAIDGFVAVSVTYLYGVYVPEAEYAWLRERQPAAKVGYSIYVYDMRKPKL